MESNSHLSPCPKDLTTQPWALPTLLPHIPKPRETFLAVTAPSVLFWWGSKLCTDSYQCWLLSDAEFSYKSHYAWRSWALAAASQRSNPAKPLRQKAVLTNWHDSGGHKGEHQVSLVSRQNGSQPMIFRTFASLLSSLCFFVFCFFEGGSILHHLLVQSALLKCECLVSLTIKQFIQMSKNGYNRKLFPLCQF